jgi:hypothetical protein
MLFGKEYDFSLIKTSSKEALLRSALSASGNDIKKAAEICDYVLKVLPNLPEVEPVAPTTFEQMKDTALGIINWGRENQDQIVNVISMVRQFMGKGSAAPTSVKPDVIFKEV